jgi:DNA-binding MarR family transcriptional regulator
MPGIPPERRKKEEASMREDDRPTEKITEELSELLGYQLHLTDLIALRGARAVLEEWQLTPAKVTALLFIREQPGCAQSALGRFLTINRASAMKLVDTLVARNFIRRGAGKDLRSHGLHLTARGAASLQAALFVLQQEDHMLSAGLSASERLDLLRLLKKVRASVQHQRLSAATAEKKVP